MNKEVQSRMKGTINEYQINIEKSSSAYDWNKLYEDLDRKSNSSKKMRDSKKSLIEFKNFIEAKNYKMLLNREINNEKDLITTMCIAYSWMPTMLEIHGNTKEIKKLVLMISKLDSIELNGPTEKELIFKLSRLTNNSIIGAVKTLHLIDPDRYPLVDSRVLGAWKNLFSNSKYKGMVAPLGVSWNLGKEDGKLIKLIEKYFYYRAVLVHWSSKLKKGVKPRDIEFRLYLIGDRN